MYTQATKGSEEEKKEITSIVVVILLRLDKRDPHGKAVVS